MATHSRQMSEAFRTTVFLTLSGGFQDAYTYMGRGKVFANAQTGNIVLMATNFCEGDFAKALRYLLPLLAFAAGVYFAEGIRNRYHLMERFHWRQLILLIEIALFAVGAAAGSLLTIHFGNRVIWFCCALLLVSLSFMFIREDIEENPELQREAAALHQDVKAMEHTIGKTLQAQQEELHPLNHK